MWDETVAGHECECDDHFGGAIDQGLITRSGFQDAPGQGAQPLALWDEGAHRYGREHPIDAREVLGRR